MLPLIELFGRTVGMYGLLAILGALVTATLGVLLGRRRGICTEDVILGAVLAGAGVLIGGHLLYGALQFPSLISQLRALPSPGLQEAWGLLTSAFGGSIFYGGLFGAIATLFLFSQGQTRVAAMDMLAVLAPLFHAFGRVGCFLGGCCYGIPCRFGFAAEQNPLVPAVVGITRFPVQLLEAGCNLLLFGFLLSLFLSDKHRGRLLPIYTLIYSLLRFWLEFLRGDAIRGFFLFFSTSQWISLLLFPLSLFLLLRTSAPRHEKPKETP